MAAECTPVDTSPAGTLRRAASKLRNEFHAVPPVALVDRLRLPLAELLESVARNHMAMLCRELAVGGPARTYEYCRTCSPQGNEPGYPCQPVDDAHTLALTVLGEQR